jgi:hypothetical protein
MGLPIRPSPMNPMRLVIVSSLFSNALFGKHLKNVFLAQFTSPAVKFPLTGPFRSLQPPIFCLTNLVHTDIAFSQMSS